MNTVVNTTKQPEQRSFTWEEMKKYPGVYEVADSANARNGFVFVVSEDNEVFAIGKGYFRRPIGWDGRTFRKSESSVTISNEVIQ